MCDVSRLKLRLQACRHEVLIDIGRKARGEEAVGGPGNRNSREREAGELLESAFVMASRDLPAQRVGEGVLELARDQPVFDRGWRRVFRASECKAINAAVAGQRYVRGKAGIFLLLDTAVLPADSQLGRVRKPQRSRRIDGIPLAIDHIDEAVRLLIGAGNPEAQRFTGGKIEVNRAAKRVETARAHGEIGALPGLRRLRHEVDQA